MATHILSALRRGLQLHSKACSRYRGASLRIRRCCSFLRARLRLASGIGSLFLALFLHNAVRFPAFPFPLLCVAISAATLAFPLTLCVLIELLAGKFSLFFPLLLHQSGRRYGQDVCSAETAHFRSFTKYESTPRGKDLSACKLSESFEFGWAMNRCV